MPTADKPPLWKQLLGAAIGGSAAFLLYMGYTTAAPDLEKLAGVLVTPQSRIETQSEEPVRVSNQGVPQEEYDRIAERARQIAQEFGAPVAPAPEEPDLPPAVQADEAPSTDGVPIEQQIEEAWVGMVAADQYEEPATEPPAYPGAEELPGAGVELWLGTLIAVAGTSALLRRRLIACARRVFVR